jgi:hypothetical protein
MTLEQARKLPELEHSATGELQHSYEIRSSSQVELVARRQGRAISFYIAHDIGLYAINIEMTPQALHIVLSGRSGSEIEQWAPDPSQSGKIWRADRLAPWDSTDLPAANCTNSIPKDGT